jgi:hypothetical protein
LLRLAREPAAVDLAAGGEVLVVVAEEEVAEAAAGGEVSVVVAAEAAINSRSREIIAFWLGQS